MTGVSLMSIVSFRIQMILIAMVSMTLMVPMSLMIPGAMGVAVLRMLLVNVAGAGFNRQMQRPQAAPTRRDKGHGEECKQDSDGLGHGRCSVSNNAGRSTIVQPDWWRSLHLHSQHAPLRPF